MEKKKKKKNKIKKIQLEPSTVKPVLKITCIKQSPILFLDPLNNSSFWRRSNTVKHDHIKGLWN